MTGQYQAMPDYLGALERELRHRAATPPPTARPAVWRRPILATSFAMAVIVPLLMITGSIGSGTRAYGRPAVLDLPVERYYAPPSKGGGFLADVSGPGELRRINAFGTDVQLSHVQDVWCVSVPDPATRQPEDERGMGCTTTRRFFRFGIGERVGPRFFAALPPDVPAPIVRHADGSTALLMPDRLGVVAVDGLRDDDSVVLQDTEGRKLRYGAPRPPIGDQTRPDQQSTMNTNKRG